MLRRIATLVLASVALAGCGGAAPGAPADAEPSGCSAVEIIGIRGQGQSLKANGGLGTEVRLIAEQLADQVASLGTVRTTPIRHASRLGTWDEYLEDVRDGRERLSTRVRSIVADCPDTRIAVIGFSQGSQIAREELADPELARHVDVLVLVGSPVHPSGRGRLGAGPDLGDLSSRTVEECVPGDPVCDKGSDDSIHRHAYEDPDVVRSIATAAAAVLTR